jgi:hypothetical protein
MDETGKVLAKRRLPEGTAGMAQLHELTGRFLPEDGQDAEVIIGIETDRGPWVAALIAAGYLRTRATQRLRHQLREYFPAAPEAFEDLDAPDVPELPGKAPDPQRAARLTRAQVSAVLKRARRRGIKDKTDAILAALRAGHLGQPPALTAACAATARALIAVITTLNEQVKVLEEQVGEHFGRHPDAEIYLSQPGLGIITGARVPGEFGDDPHRYVSVKARRNYGGTSPITRASGKKKIVLARFIHNDRLTAA